MVKATVCGAAGGIGQSLSLLLKMDPYLDELSLFDVVNSPGVGLDLSHINTHCKINLFLPLDDGLKNLLKDSDLVIIPAGVPRKPGMTRDDLFKVNGGIVRDLLQGILDYLKKGVIVLVISNPINSTVPIVAEVLKKNGVYDPKRCIGVNTLDLVRLVQFMKETAISIGESVSSGSFVPIIGGHSGETIVPLYSVLYPEVYSKLSSEQKLLLIHRLQYGGDEVVALKNGAGSLTLSMLYASYRISSKLIKLLADKSNEETEEIGFIDISSRDEDLLPGMSDLKSILKSKYEESELKYVSVPIKMTLKGVSAIDVDCLTKCNEEEDQLILTAIDQLKRNITKGSSFITGQV